MIRFESIDFFITHTQLSVFRHLSTDADDARTGVRVIKAPNAFAPNVTTVPELSPITEFAYPAAMPRISRIPAGIVRCPWVFVPHPTTFAALVTTSEYCKPAVTATTGGRSQEHSFGHIGLHPMQ